MRYVCAYLLACLGGNKNPTAQDIRDILGSVGIDADEERLNLVVSQLEGKNIEQVLEGGRAKLATVGAGAMLTSSGGPSPGTTPTAEEKSEEKKEAPPPAEESSSSEDMGMSLFD